MIEAKDSSALPQAFNRAIKYTALFIIPIAILVSGLSDPFILLIYGEEYQFASIYLKLLALTYLFSPLTMVAITYFNGVGLNIETLKTRAIYFLIVLILAPILTMYLRVIGGVIALLMASILTATYSLYTCYKLKLPIDIKYLSKIYVSSLASIAIASTISLSLNSTSLIMNFTNLLISGLIYVFLLSLIMSLLNIPTNQDIQFIKKYFGNIKLIGPLVSLLTRYFEFIKGFIPR